MSFKFATLEARAMRAARGMSRMRGVKARRGGARSVRKQAASGGSAVRSEVRK
jgi:hypothetical protein